MLLLFIVLLALVVQVSSLPLDDDYDICAWRNAVPVLNYTYSEPECMAKYHIRESGKCEPHYNCEIGEDGKNDECDRFCQVSEVCPREHCTILTSRIGSHQLLLWQRAILRLCVGMSWT